MRPGAVCHTTGVTARLLPVLERYSWVSALVAVIGVPLIFDPRTADAFGVPKTALLWLCATAGMTAWVGCIAIERHRPRLDRFWVCTGALAVVIGASTALSENWRHSLLGAYTRNGGMLSVLACVSIAWLVYRSCAHRPARRSTLLWALSTTSGLVAGYLLVQVAGWDPLHYIQANGAAVHYQASTLGNPDFAGGYLAIGMTALVALIGWRGAAGWQSEQRLASIALVALGVAQAAALWFSQSRDGLIAAAAGLIAVVAWEFRLLPRRLRPAAVVMAACVAAAAALGLAVLIVHPSPNGPLGWLAKLNVLRSQSFSIRLRIWQAAGHIIAARPVLGHGLDTFGLDYPRYRSLLDAQQLGLQITDEPHDIFLAWAAGTGLVGLAIYAAAVVVGFARLKGRLSQADGPGRWLVGGLGATLVAYLVQGLVSIDMPALALTGWVVLAAVAAPTGLLAANSPEAARQATGTVRPRARTAPGRPRVGGQHRPIYELPVVFAAAAIVITVLTVRYFAADVRAAEASRDIAARGLPAAATAAASAAHLNGEEPDYRLLQATVALSQAAKVPPGAPRQALLASTLGDDQRAAALDPHDVAALLAMAEAESAWAEGADASGYAAANAAWIAVERSDPRDWVEPGQQALLLNAWANAEGGSTSLRSQAAACAESAVKLNPANASAWLDLGQLDDALGRSQRAHQAFEAALRLDPSNRTAQSGARSSQG
jgi:O-antigen ligase